jgi:predicted NAD/FAD-binding protein
VESERFSATYDQVIFACHSDQALQLLADASGKEKTILGAIPYNRNQVVLHTDASMLPHNRKCWSSWNVAMNGNAMTESTLTYNMNILQGLESDDTFCVTLNQTGAIDPAAIISEFEYDHPVFTEAGILAQERWHEINGTNNTWFCGAYWRNGFHEDGVWSALRVARGIGNLPVEDAAPVLLAEAV